MRDQSRRRVFRRRVVDEHVPIWVETRDDEEVTRGLLIRCARKLARLDADARDERLAPGDLPLDIFPARESREVARYAPGEGALDRAVPVAVDVVRAIEKA